jgi:tetratricopeptide (TPR) repeat protein
MRLKLLRFCLIFAAATLCVGGSAQQTPTHLPSASQNQPASLSSPTGPNTAAAPSPPADYSQESSVIEQARSSMRFENDGSSNQVVYVRVRVQKAEGAQAWGQLVFSYSSANEKIHADYVRVHKPDGTVVTAGADAIQDLSSPIEREAPAYSDIRQIHITVPGLTAGDILEYEIRTDTTSPLVPGEFFTQWNSSQEIITLDETLELNLPQGREVHVKTASGVSGPEERADGDRRILTWHSSFTKRPSETEEENILKILREVGGKQPDVQISTFKSWQDVGRWYVDLEQPRAEVTDSIRAKADEIVKGQRTKLGKAKAIFEYVETNIRYVSLSFGLGRFQPHSAPDVLASQYGDCKDKATLFQALLAAEKIESFPVLINSQHKIDPDVPSPLQFDHLISLVLLDGTQYWADTTAGAAPFGLLLSTLRDSQALVMEPKGKSELENTPADPPFPAATSVSVEGTVDSLGRFQGKLSLSVMGELAVYLRGMLRTVPQSNWSQVADGVAKQQFGGTPKVSDFHFSGMEDVDAPLVFEVEFSAPSFLDLSKKDLALGVPSGVLVLPSVVAPDKNSAKPLELGGIRDQLESWKIEFPAQVKVSVPVPVHITRDYGEYESTYQLDGQNAHLERHLIIRQSKVPPALYNDVKAFSSVVTADEGQKLVLTNTTPGMGSELNEMSADDLFDAARTAESARNFTEAARLYAAAAEKDPDHENVWNALGHAYNMLNEFDKAVPALEKAIAKNPFDPYAYNNLGQAYRGLGQLDKAVPEYQKQIEINPLDQYAHANLGWTYLSEKRYDLALKELQTAIQITPQNLGLEGGIGDAQLGLHQEEAALASFQIVLEKSPDPANWNNVAYLLSKHAARLDLAEKYSRDSIRAVEAETDGITLATVGALPANLVRALGAYWDTMGWIKFQEGDFKGAKQYVLAAWILVDSATVADHLGQIYEKESRRDDAIRLYASALALPNPPFETRGRLVALIGEGKIDAAVEAARPTLATRRSVKLGNPHGLDAKGRFWVLLSNESGVRTPKIEDVKFISGDGKNDNALRGFTDLLRAAKLPYLFPRGEKGKIVVQGALVCVNASHECVFTPFSTDETLRSLVYRAGAVPQ